MPKQYGGSLAEKDQKVLQALDKAKEHHEDLAEWLDLSRDLLRLRYEAKSRIPLGDEIWEPDTMEDRLEQGQPLLDFDRLPLDPASFEDLVRQVVATLIRHHPELAEQEEALEGTDYIILAREWYEKGRGVASASDKRSRSLLSLPTSVGTGLAPAQGRPQGSPLPDPRDHLSSVVGRSLDLATLAVANTLAPYLERAAEAIMPHVDELRWLRPYCPVCGGQPDFAALDQETGARRLLCSRCNAGWRFKRLACPFCNNEDQKRLAYYPSADEVYRLYVCEACRRYLKTVDLRQLSRVFFPEVERVLTVGMDVAAVEAGYRGHRT